MKPDYEVRLKTNGASRLMMRVTGKDDIPIDHLISSLDYNMRNGGYPSETILQVMGTLTSTLQSLTTLALSRSQREIRNAATCNGA
uniref:Uncharacterized protein n=1 Tax=Candidatus Kentrum eta TaxID=2126337 RepID=A0A450VKP9_9GAMM|nr:MAG: hypothetical protein BECKH772B_GA0070898_105801 [Candidatus Kentron sp. H]VFK06218.1 MAG: hypothetical protein BECKH772A_GA0070896_106231 [Candidatus Kentron sp. H]VFK09908.1 MAG: hypothetical protein BECKH772C_GA0070978_106571 [Candidatus Kentron sp. H]